MAYPMNIGLSFIAARQQLKAIKPDLTLVLVAQSYKDEKKYRATLATVQAEDTDISLYNVPVRPYQRMIGDRRQRQRLRLLDSLFAFLYRRVAFPYCGPDDSSYFDDILSYTIDEDGIYASERDAEEEYGDHYKAAKRKVFDIRRLCLQSKKRFNHEYHVQQLSQRVNSFKPKSELDQDLLIAAQKLVEVECHFPHHSFKMATDNHHLEIKDRAEGTIFVDQIATFVWSDNDEFYSLYTQFLDDEMSSGCDQEPLQSVQVFDSPQAKDIHADYQEYYQLLLDAVGDLGAVLSRMDHGKCE
ncbi:hypothetical protein [Fibrella aestuarina]|nr:hypothetical protein [Fibrella aestuarina]